MAQTTYPLRKYRIVCTCFDSVYPPYAEGDATLLQDKDSALALAKSMAEHECSTLNKTDDLPPGCFRGFFEVDDCANNDFEVRRYEKAPDDRGEGDCDIEYVTTYNVYPVDFNEQYSCFYRGFNVESADGERFRILHNGACLWRIDSPAMGLEAVLEFIDDLCLECAKYKTYALDTVHKVPLDVVVKFASAQREYAGVFDGLESSRGER